MLPAPYTNRNLCAIGQNKVFFHIRDAFHIDQVTLVTPQEPLVTDLCFDISQFFRGLDLTSIHHMNNHLMLITFDVHDLIHVWIALLPFAFDWNSFFQMQAKDTLQGLLDFSSLNAFVRYPEAWTS